VKMIRKLILGFFVAIAFMTLSIALAATGKYLGFNTFLSPLLWPFVIFMIPGLVAIPIFDHLPGGGNLFVWMFPDGGASGVFGAMLVTAIVIWTIIFSSFGVAEKLVDLTRSRKKLTA